MNGGAFPGIPLRTERLLLRPHHEADAGTMFEIHSDPLVMRFWSTPAWTSIERGHELAVRNMAAFESGEYLALAIERTGDGQMIGQCTLFNLSATCRRAEIGYALASRAWGRGYMNEALHALIRYGFERMNLNRIEADIDPLNEASARSLQRLGFRREGLLRERWIVGGAASDSEMYGLLHAEWRAGDNA